MSSANMTVQAIGNEQMQAEGKQKRAEAEAKNKISEQKQNAEGNVESLKGNVKDKVGSAIGNEQMVCGCSHGPALASVALLCFIADGQTCC